MVLPFTEVEEITQQATDLARTVEKQVLAFCQQPKSRAEIQEHLGLKDREHFRQAEI